MSNEFGKIEALNEEHAQEMREFIEEYPEFGLALLEGQLGDVMNARWYADNYVGEYEDWEDYARQLVKDGVFGVVNEDLINYINYELLGLTLSYEDHEVASENGKIFIFQG